MGSSTNLVKLKYAKINNVIKPIIPNSTVIFDKLLDPSDVLYIYNLLVLPSLSTLLKFLATFTFANLYE